MHSSRSVSVHRARDRETGASVVLKTAKPGAANVAKLRYECSILKDLNVPGVVRLLDVHEEQGGEMTLVLADHGGESLAARLARGPLPLSDALRLGVEVATALGHVHDRRIIHKDINPSNLLIDGGGHAWLLDWDIATRLPREIHGVCSPNQLIGTLTYISPEQTGRMNRAIEHRTDLYSFGVTLYEALTGRVPFSSSDPIELIHAHIAKTPTPPSEVDPRIPKPVSDIVMRLLEKMAEARYQSAFGLKTDLEECLRRLERDGRIDPFPLAEHDLSDRFEIPQKLYGRAEEIATLEGAFARVKEGVPELLLVTGSSGIGKSSVIQELYKSLSQTRGNFVSGKFDQLKRDIPFSALLQALSELVRGILAEPEEQIALSRKRILRAVSGAGRVLTDVLPELELVIGPQPPLPALDAAESKNRFRIAFENFIHEFHCHGQPLVIFLDDLQWADAATLDLLPALIGGPKSGSLLVIGAYRENEIPSDHLLLTTLAAMEKAKSRISRIALSPIPVTSVRELVEDALAIGPEEAQPLAELLWQRTEGNPLFVGELLTMLHRNGLIELDRERRRWTFDLAQIERAPSTDNVGQLMAARAATLSEQGQDILRLAAVLGNRFDLKTLTMVAERSADETKRALDEALQEGLVLSSGLGDQGVYRFLHDRVQQTVYASIPEEARAQLHHRTGQVLLRNRPVEEHDDWRFNVLHHLNIAPALVRSPEERIEIAHLNLTAAKRARASGAFAAASSLYRAGIAFMPEGSWIGHHDDMFTMHLGRAESEYLAGDHASAERLFDVLLKQATSNIEKGYVHELTLRYYLHVTKYEEAIASGLKALEILGLKLDPKPVPPRMLLEFMLLKRVLKKTTSIANAPTVTEPELLLTHRILYLLSILTFLSKKIFLWIEVTVAHTRLSLNRGLCQYSSSAFVSTSQITAVMLGDHAEALRLANLALAVCERYPGGGMEVLIKQTRAYMCLPWVRPVKEAFGPLEEAVRDGLLSGNLMGLGYVVAVTALLRMFEGQPLPERLQSCEESLQFMQQIKHNFSLRTLRSMRQVTLALQGLTLGPASFETHDFDDARHLSELAADPDAAMELHYTWVFKIMALYILNRHEEALALSDQVRKSIDKALAGAPEVSTYRFFDALLLAGRAEKQGMVARQRDLFLIRGHLRKFKAWTEHAPTNFRHKYLLLSAELSRLTNDEHAALGQYEEAIALAHENQFLHDEAIALELASRCFQARGLHDAAIRFLAQSRQLYARWGAHAKVALLDQAYPGLAARTESEGQAPAGTISTTTTARTTTLDVPSMIKASQALSGEISLDKLLLRLMSIVAENAGAERGFIILKQQSALVVAAEFSVQKGAALPEQVVPVTDKQDLSQGIVNYVFRTRETIVLGDAAKDGPFIADAYVARRKPRALLCTPLLQKGEVMGVLYLENNLVPDAFTQDRAELLNVLCSQMAISIDNALLYADLEQKVIERTRELREAQARLVRLEKEATENQMAGGFAHEMRNALAVAKLVLAKVYRSPGANGEPWSICMDNSRKLMDVFLRVRDHLPDETLDDISVLLAEMNKGEAQVDASLRNISGSLERGLGITGFILKYAQVGLDQPGSDVVSVASQVSSLLSALEDDFASNRIKVETDVPSDCTVTMDEVHFSSILSNLVLNARDAIVEVTDANQPREIRIRAEDAIDSVVISVIDTGVGIQPELREKIFEPFFSTKPSTGTGLGLGMVRKLTSIYGGTVDFDSTPQRGTTFRVTFPKTVEFATSPTGSGARAYLNPVSVD